MAAMQASPKIPLRVIWLGSLTSVVWLCCDCARPEPVADGGVDSDADSDAPVTLDGDVSGDGQPPICDDDVCDLWPQCGCQPGEACIHLQEGGRSCVDAGSSGHGEECSGDGSDCGAGMLCTGYGDEPPYCLQYCRNDDDCSSRGQGSLCELQLQDELGHELARACSIDCDPTSSTPACAEGIHCVIFVTEDTGELFTHCVGASGSGEAGAVCEPSNGAADCQPGLFCADAGEGYECIRRCTMPEGLECSADHICRSFPEPVIIGTTEYGYCL